MKKLFLFMAIFSMGICQVNAAQEEPITVYLFWSSSCGYCGYAIEDLNEIEQEYEDIFEIVTYQVSDGDNTTLFSYLVNEFGAGGGIPFFVIGDQTVEGYAIDTVLEIAQEEYESDDYVDVVSEYEEEYGPYSAEDLEYACDIKGIEYLNANTVNTENESNDITSFIAGFVLAIMLFGVIYVIAIPKTK